MNDTSTPATRRILHLDMDAFFAAVELRRRPELRGLPVIIGGRGDPTRRGVVATATYEARRFGVHSGMPFRTAHRLCPQAIYLPTDFAEYARWSQVFKAAMRDVSPLFEDRGIDEAYLDIGAAPQTSEAIGRALKARIVADTGMTCSIGIAPNKLLAKIASDLEKPDGLTILLPEDIAARVWPLPARKIPGIGPKAEQRLAALRIRTIGISPPRQSICSGATSALRWPSSCMRRPTAATMRRSSPRASRSRAAAKRPSRRTWPIRRRSSRRCASLAQASPRICRRAATPVARSASSCASPTSRR